MIDDAEAMLLIDALRRGDVTPDDERIAGPIVEKACGSFVVPGEDGDDVRQAAWVSMLDGAKRYDQARGLPGSFMCLCAHHGALTLARQAKCRKYGILNGSARFSRNAEWNDLNEAASLDPTPLDADVAREDLDSLLQSLFSILTQKERAVAGAYMAGLDYSEIGELAGMGLKQVDNALQRVLGKAARVGARRDMAQFWGSLGDVRLSRLLQERLL